MNPIYPSTKKQQTDKEVSFYKNKTALMLTLFYVLSKQP
jgi:hypothetical protein